MSKRILSLLLVLLILTAGCGGQDTTDSNENESETEFQEEAWETYQAALTATAALTDRQEEVVVVTTESTRSEETEETIRLVITQLGLDTDSPELSAVGTVSDSDTSVDLEIYYLEGWIYTLTGEVAEKYESTFDAAFSAVDFLSSFIEELSEDYFSNCMITEYADGTIIIDLNFEGEISGTETTGSGEVIIDETGIIVSHRYDLETSYRSNGAKVTTTQAVEVTMLSYGDLVSSIEYPDFSDYEEIVSGSEAESESDAETDSEAGS